VVLLVAGCGGGSTGKVQAIFTAGGRPGAAQLNAAARVVEKRANAYGAKHAFARVRTGRIEVGATSNLRPLLTQLAVPGRLAFYDWEPNLVSKAPVPLSAARRLARPGTRVIADEHGGHGYWVIRDRAALTNGDIVNPKQSFDQATGTPNVTFGFTARGRAAFERVTRAEALRGAQLPLPPGGDRQSTFQHFAIVLDDRLVSLAYISYIDNPEGIDGRNGAELNGVGSVADTQRIAQELALGPLPLRLSR